MIKGITYASLLTTLYNVFITIITNKHYPNDNTTHQHPTIPNNNIKPHQTTPMLARTHAYMHQNHAGEVGFHDPELERRPNHVQADQADAD